MMVISIEDARMRVGTSPWERAVEAEVRPWIGSYVSLAQFKLNREIRIVDCVSEPTPVNEAPFSIRHCHRILHGQISNRRMAWKVQSRNHPRWTLLRSQQP